MCVVCGKRFFFSFFLFLFRQHVALFVFSTPHERVFAMSRSFCNYNSATVTVNLSRLDVAKILNMYTFGGIFRSFFFFIFFCCSFLVFVS